MYHGESVLPELSALNLQASARHETGKTATTGAPVLTLDKRPHKTTAALAQMHTGSISTVHGCTLTRTRSLYADTLDLGAHTLIIPCTMIRTHSCWSACTRWHTQVTYDAQIHAGARSHTHTHALTHTHTHSAASLAEHLLAVAARYHGSVGVELFLPFWGSQTPDIASCPGGLLAKIAASYHESVGTGLFLWF